MVYLKAGGLGGKLPCAVDGASLSVRSNFAVVPRR